MTADLGIWALPLAIVAVLVFSAVLAAAQTALSAASRSKLRTMAERGIAGAATALRLNANPERLIGAILLLDTLAIVLATALATRLALRVSLPMPVAIVSVLMAVTALILTQFVPKILSIAQPETMACRLAPLLQGLVVVVTPVVVLLRQIARALLRPFGIAPDPNGHLLALRDEIAGAISLGHSGGAMEKADRDRLLGALDLSDRTVDEIMRHRRQIQMINADDDPGDIITQVLASPHSRLPVFRGSEDNILGVIHTKELLREVDRLVRGEAGAGPDGIKGLDIVKVAMKPYFIPDTTGLDEQMRAFLARRTHFAMVVDEYGGLQGLITLEDILEEIVGEITDEFDVAPRDSGLKRGDTGDYLVDGTMTIRDLNRAMDWSLPDSEANTIAGLVIHEAQMIPLEGQIFRFHGFQFEVAQRRENRLSKLKLRPL